MKLLIEAKQIPNGATVSKKTGDCVYTLRDEIKIWGTCTPENMDTLKELRSDKETRFMISENGNINVVSGDKELLWHASNEELYRFFYNKTQLDHK